MSGVANLDQVMQEFLDMKTVIEELSFEHNRINTEFDALSDRYCTHVQSKKNCDEELKKYQELIEKYQKMLGDFTRIKGDNNHLKENLAKTKSEKLQLEQSIIANNDNFMLQIEQLEKKQRSEIDKVQQDANDLAVSEISIYKDKLQEVTFELEESKSALIDKGREHKLEVARLKLEYDTNIQKIQHRQLALANTSSGSLSARNDIFRKKLQHLQHESEKELKDVKAKYNEQQQQISDQQHQLKIGNKQLQELAMKHRQEMEKMEKALHQSQNEIRRLRNELEHEKSYAISNEDTIPRYDVLAGKRTPSGKKRKKMMFNPHRDRLSPSP